MPFAQQPQNAEIRLVCGKQDGGVSLPTNPAVRGAGIRRALFPRRNLVMSGGEDDVFLTASEKNARKNTA